MVRRAFIVGDELHAANQRTEDQQLSDVIRTGHVRRGYIAAVEGLHSELKFTYSPMLGEVVEKTESEIRRLDATKAYQFLCAQVQRHLKSWSEGEPNDIEPIDEESTRRLLHPKMLKLYKIISGLEASDPHDTVQNDPARVGTSYADEVLASVTPGMLNQETTEGNSNEV